RHFHVTGVQTCALPIFHRVRVLEAPPAAPHDAPAPDLLVAGQGVVEEVEHVVVHGHGLFDEVQAAQQTRQVVGEHLRGRDGAHPTGVQRGRVYVPALHEAAHLPGDPADLQGTFVDLPLEGVERAHDVGDGAGAVEVAARGLGRLGLFEQAGVGLGDHAFAEVDEDHVVLED